MTDICVDLIKDIEFKVDLLGHQIFCIINENLDDFNLIKEIKIIPLYDSISYIKKNQITELQLMIIKSDQAQALLFKKTSIEKLIENHDFLIFFFSESAVSLMKISNFYLNLKLDIKRLFLIRICEENKTLLNDFCQLLEMIENDGPLYQFKWKPLIQQKHTIKQNEYFKKSLDLNFLEDDVLLHELKQKKVHHELFIKEEFKRKKSDFQLLSFFDFLFQEIQSDLFIEKLSDFLKTDLKKEGIELLLAFEVFSQEFVDIFFMSQKSFEYKSVNRKNYTHLVDSLQIPISQLKSLFLDLKEKSFKISFFNLNQIGLDKTDFIQQYFAERLNMMAFAVMSHMSLMQNKFLLKRWESIKQSVEFRYHIIDADFNIVDANYLVQSTEYLNKCYLNYGLKEPCLSCPVIKRETQINLMSENIQIRDKTYKLLSNIFYIEGHEKPYYYHIYLDQTEWIHRQTEIIHLKKMNSLSHLSHYLMHEINNPLTGLKLMTLHWVDQIQKVMGLNEVDTDKLTLVHKFNEIHNGISTNLLSDLLEVLEGIKRCQFVIATFDSFVHFDHSLELKKIKMKALVETSLSFLKSLMKSTRVLIDVQDFEVLIHPVYFQQIVYNLVKNSIEAQEGHGTLKIYTVKTNNLLDLYFEDSGPGLPEKILKNLFMPFKTTKDFSKGTGLGLSISKKWAELMGADLFYDEKYKSGARFILRFKNENNNL